MAGKLDRLLQPAVLCLILFLRLFKLDEIPSDIYGDIIILFNYLSRIRALRWPWAFDRSVGPLYHYLIAPITLPFGFNYLSVKLASVAVSLAVIWATHLLTLQLGFGRRAAWLATFVSGVSCWLLIFSRLGNSQILTPLLSVLAFYLLARLEERTSRRAIFWLALVSALGLYCYPQTFILPAVSFLTLLYLRRRARIGWRDLAWFVALSMLFAAPFVAMVAHDPAEFLYGYIGSKLIGEPAYGPEYSKGAVLFINMGNSLAMLHVRGDSVFRSNPRSWPHLDPVSGALFLLGLIFLSQAGNRRALIFLVWPWLVLQIPSILVLNRPWQVPSASRTLLVTPFVYIIVALGMEFLLQKIRQQQFRRATLLLLCGLICCLNWTRYFVYYVNGLPDKNLSIARAIAQKVDELPEEAIVYVVSCCWGQANNPERGGIAYAVAEDREIHFIEPDDIDCAIYARANSPMMFIMGPNDSRALGKLNECYPGRQSQVVLGKQGREAFRYLWKE